VPAEGSKVDELNTVKTQLAQRNLKRTPSTVTGERGNLPVILALHNICSGYTIIAMGAEFCAQMFLSR
jgi:hypothetical protein